LEEIDARIAAVVVEPVQAEGGVRIPKADFIQALRQRCDETGAMLIFDEVLTGFGRTGRLFAFEHFGAVPDLIVLAKAIGGGLPLGAFCGSDEILGVLVRDPPLGHLTTFGGHPLSSATGLAALDVIVRERLWERAATLGDHLVGSLRGALRRGVTEIRGIGLLVGIEFNEASLARRFVAESIARGIVINWTLNADRVVRLAPTLTIADDEVDIAIDVMTAALAAALP
jgi:acetylornithine/succinyldiaminopimelate/putrescine aminotransferase